MLYPNNIKKHKKENINYANRGMDLENLLNEANNYYLLNDIAVIYKKPTPIKINKVKYGNFPKVIDGSFNQKSTLDYVGIYKGKYLDFDAKSTKNKTSFPLSNIHNHQIIHMERIIKHGGITFLIIDINQEIFLVKGEDIIKYYNSSKIKSIPYKLIKEIGYQIRIGYNPIINYIEAINEAYFKGEI